MISTRRTMWMLAAGLLALLAAAACDEGGGGSPLDDGLPDTDTDNDVPVNLCASYPEADNSFGLGEVVRNYTFFDRQDEEHQLCEVGGGNRTLLLLVISSSTWGSCSSEVGNLASLQNQYAADGVVVMEMLQDANSVDALLAWPATDDYMVVRTVPATQAQMDYVGMLGYPTLPLIDLQTMQVVNPDCFTAGSYAACIDEALAAL